MKEKVLNILKDTEQQIQNTNAENPEEFESILKKCYDDCYKAIEPKLIEKWNERLLQERTKQPWAKYFTLDELRDLSVDDEFQIYLIWEIVTDRDYKRRYNLSDDADIPLIVKKEFNNFKERKRVESEIIKNLKDYSVKEVKETGNGLVATLCKNLNSHLKKF